MHLRALTYFESAMQSSPKKILRIYREVGGSGGVGVILGGG